MRTIRGWFKLNLGDFHLDAEFEAPGRGVTSLFGPSGSGKTTLLRCIAGLERASNSYLEVNGELWQDDLRSLFLPTHLRPIGYVFQEPGLFPHLTVRENLEYGFKRTPIDRRRIMPEQTIDWLGLASLLHRHPPSLSGGERQRVAIGRALLTSPRLLLMDEPLAALDAASKMEIFPYLEKLHVEMPMPVLYVTHSMDEVARLADHMLAIEGGRIVAAGPLSETLTRLDWPLARGDEAGTVVDAVVAGHDNQYHLTYLDFSGGRLAVPQRVTSTGATVRVRLLAREVILSIEPPLEAGIPNIFITNVVEILDISPAMTIVRLDAGGAPLLARVLRKTVAELGLQRGMWVSAQIKSVELMS